MKRILVPLFALIAFPVFAADPPAAGTWKYTLPLEGQNLTFLLMLTETDKGWVGDYLGCSTPLRVEPTISDVRVKDDLLSFNLKLAPTAVMNFDGRLPKQGKKIPGSLTFQGKTSLVELIPSKLKNFSDTFAAARETLETVEGGQELFDATFAVLSQATVKNLKPEEVRTLTDKAAKSAETYGPRWQRTTAVKLAAALVDQQAFVGIAVEQARQAERMLTDADDAAAQMQILDVVVRTLVKAGKADEAKPIQARLTKLELKDYAENEKKNPIVVEAFTGRKGMSDRVVLAELFTGAECPPCVASDLAFDALEKTFKPTEVVLLQYHMHVPGPDPLTSKDGLDRAKMYGDKIEGTPSIFFNGKKDESGGGGTNAAKAKYGVYRKQIEPLLETPAGAKLQLAASKTGEEITIKANVSDVAKPGEKVTLRIVLAEERVKYAGGNGLRYHHCVVRAMPGGAKGQPVTQRTMEYSTAVNVSKLRTELAKYLEEYAKENDDFPNADRPLALTNLRLVAFVQDDATGEVLQAVSVPVDEK